MNNKTIILSAEKLWMESPAIDQAEALSRLRDVERVYAMPDLHAGKTPVGVTVVVNGRIYPHIIGGDVGCGMSVFDTGVQISKMKLDKWASRLNTIKTLSAVPNTVHFPGCPIPDFGTIGSGNHFAEFQTADGVFIPDVAERLGIYKDKVYMTVHSGSRSYGSEIIRTYGCYDGYELQSKEAVAYLAAHDDALGWASKNRVEVMLKLLRYLGYDGAADKKLECVHNYAEVDGGTVYHRKGSVSSENGAAYIAGSRGTLSYIVMPTEKCREYGRSLAHGSGRKWARSMCKSRIKDKYTSATIKQNKYKGVLVCHDLELVYQEAPDAYKSIDAVIAALKGYGMIEVVATMRPMLTFKG